MTPWSGAPWTPRDWQGKALPVVVDAARQGKRALISAVMGSGKSILLTELAWLAAHKSGHRAIVINTPTRKLVRQLAATVAARCGPGNVGMYFDAAKQADRLIIVTCNPSMPSLRVELAAQRRPVALLISDEAHQTEGPEVKAAIEGMSPASLVGFTATPYRSDKSQSLELFDTIAYRYTLGDALRDRVLVPWRVVNWTGVDGANVDDVVSTQLRAQAQGPGIVSATSIADAEEYAARLTGDGFRAEAIHSKLSTAAQEDLLAQLQAGGLRALVHVSLLSEGVDLPWLRWLCLRRPVGARVRFAQEMGRVLRCHPGKKVAQIFDPHDLFGAFGVAQAPALGPQEPEELMPYADAIGELEIEAEGVDPKKREMPGAKAVALTTQWSRQLLLSLQMHGLADSSQVPDGRWRTRPASPKQVEALQRMLWAARYLPEDHRASVKAIAQTADVLQRGAVSDLIDVLRAVADASAAHRKARRHWRWPPGLVVDPLHPAAVRSLPVPA